MTPSLIVRGGANAIAFYKKAFNATEGLRLPAPDGTIMHAEIKIGDSAIFLADESPDLGWISPLGLGGSGGAICLYVENVDATIAQALEAGAVVKHPVADQFWGDRMGSIIDPFGHTWSIATHMEDVSEEEISRRAHAWSENQS